MRKQYHFYPGASGFDAWDVDRLVASSQQLPVKQVALDSFWQVDTVYWTEPFTVRKFAEHVRLVQAVDRNHPIILAADGRVMDGMHRIVRALIEEDRTIAAVQFDVTPGPDSRDCRLEDLPFPDDDTELSRRSREAGNRVRLRGLLEPGDLIVGEHQVHRGDRVVDVMRGVNRGHVWPIG